MKRGTKIALTLLSLAGAVALGVAAATWLGVWSLLRIFDLSVPPEALTRTSVVDWSGPWPEGAEVTLVMGEASRATGNRWAYRMLDEADGLDAPEAEFGYYRTIFEQVTSVRGDSRCERGGHPYGHEIVLSVDGARRETRHSCRLSAIDFAALWQRATPVEMHDEALPRAAHRAALLRLASDPAARVIDPGASDYSPFDARITGVLPVLWVQPPGPRDPDLRLALERRLSDALTRLAPAGWELQLTDANADGPMLRPLERAPDSTAPLRFRRYLMAGPEGLRAVSALDLARLELRIRCVQSACEAISGLDLAAALAPYRDPVALARAYALSPPAEADEAERVLDPAGWEDEPLPALTPAPLTYRLRWVER